MSTETAKLCVIFGLVLLFSIYFFIATRKHPSSAEVVWLFVAALFSAGIALTGAHFGGASFINGLIMSMPSFY
jgi:hypothetical protein